MADQLDPDLSILAQQAGDDWIKPVPRSPVLSPQQSSDLIQPIPRSPSPPQQTSNLIRPMATRADRNNNPGNLKRGPYDTQYGVTSYDPQGYAVFPDWYSGARAHGDLLKRHYHGMTIPQMSQKYSPGTAGEWARNVMKIGGYKHHDVPNLNDPVELARLQNAIMREEGRSRAKQMPRPRPADTSGVPLPQPRPEGAPGPEYAPQPLPEQPGLPQQGDQPDWYKRMIEHQQRWGMPPATEQIPGIIDMGMDVADLLSPLMKMPLAARAGRGLFNLARRGQGMKLEEADGPSFQKQRSPDKDYGNVDIRRRMEQLQREPAPSPPRASRVKPPRRDYTIEEIGEAMRQIMRERGMEP